MSTKRLTLVEMVERFQCPGCLHGPTPSDCDKFKLGESGCDGHVAGTFISSLGRIALGLPKGFNRFGARDELSVRLFAEGTPLWDHLNVPVWKMHVEGFLFVRTYLPRVNGCFVDVIQSPKELPGIMDRAIDVATFIGEVD
jgi:hypothetical protein